MRAADWSDQKSLFSKLTSEVGVLKGPGQTTKPEINGGWSVKVRIVLENQISNI